MLGPPPSLSRDEVDQKAIAEVLKEIRRRIPKDRSPGAFFSDLVRQAIDEVLSLTPRRFALEHMAAPEQTYIGIRTEILIREALDVGAGKRADVQIAGHEVDLKWSKSLKWMIGPENLGTVCLGVGINADQLLSVGLFVPHADVLGSPNRDKKLGITKVFRDSRVTWLVRDEPLPPNFFETLSKEVREDIMSRGSVQERMRRFAQLVPNRPFPRSAIRFVSLNADDPMRRVREDANLKDPPLGEMRCLGAKYRKRELAALGIALKPDEFIFVERKQVEIALGKAKP